MTPSDSEHFRTTHWSAVLGAAQSRAPGAEQALAELCQTYWYPLYAYLRRKGNTPTEAEDITQQFFAGRVVTRLIFKGVNPGSGRFRTWLLTSLQNMVRNDWERQHAQKRGGYQPHVSIDFQEGETRYGHEPSHSETPEKLYDRAWAVTLLRHALSLLQEQYALKGEKDLFAELACYLPGALAPPGYAQTAARIKRTEAATKMAVSRLRRDYGRVLRQEIQRTLADSLSVEAELRELFQILAD